MSTTHQISPGLRLVLPEGLRVQDRQPRRATRRRRSGEPEDRTGDETDALFRALAAQGFVTSETFAATPDPTAPQRPRRGGRAEERSVRLEVDLGAGEEAVVLVEQEGVYSWRLPDDVLELEEPEPEGPGAPTGSRRRRSSRPQGSEGQPSEGRGAARRSTFTLPLETSARRPNATHRPRRGVVEDLAVGALRGIVLRFVAGPTVDGIVRFQERNVIEGPVVIDSVDPDEWQRGASLDDVDWPRDRAARILLLVHGTFSSTLGSFGALGAYTWGRQLIDRALDHYDLILGWDHRTLSASPLENASDLHDELARVLAAAGIDRPPTLDAVAFSRGGLVFRSLVELLLPAGQLKLDVGRAVFVGCTNAGTHLAEPDNWHALLDLYTNLAAGAAKALGMAAAAPLAGRIVAGAVDGLGALAKALATAAITRDRAPGLAAMEPDGEFVRELNRLQAGQPTAGTTSYFAVTSIFDARNGGPSELGRALVARLADGFTDQLLQVPNDLIVDVDSMSAIDRGHGEFVRDRLDFGPNGAVYHTVYFHQPEVIDCLDRWLDLDAGTSLRTPRGAATTAGARPPSAAEPPSAPLHRNIRRLPADIRAGAAADVLARHGGSYVVVERDHGGELLHYARPTASTRARLEAAPSEASVLDALDLHEHERSEEVGEAGLDPRLRPDPGQPLVVVDDRGRSIGIVATSAARSAEELSALDAETPPTRRRRTARRTKRRPSGGSERRTRSGGDAEAAGGGAAEGTEGPTRCSFRADTDQQVEVGSTTSVVVTIAREALEAAAGRASATAVADVDVDRRLLVQLIPRAHCKAVGERRVEIDPPAPGRPIDLVFDYEPTHAGRGAVWIVVRQSSVSLATLVLEPEFVDPGSPVVDGRSVANAVSAESDPLPRSLQQLRIYDLVDGDEWFLMYDLSLPAQRINETFESQRSRTDRGVYVGDLYEKLEAMWARNDDQFEDFLRDARAYGATLFRDLFPAEMQRLLWAHREALDGIQVISQEPFIPWEIVHLQEPGGRLAPDESWFLGEMGLVRWLHGSKQGWPPARITVRADRCHVVVPTYADDGNALPATTEEREILQALIGARPVDPASSREVLELLMSSDAVDLIHFACHGVASPSEIWNAGLELGNRAGTGEPDRLEVDTVESYAALDDDGHPPLVFVNACQTGRGGRRLVGTGGMAQAFLRAGAGAFVGALWSIDDRPSLEFAQELYRSLRSGRNFSEATRAAREAAKNQQDFTWLSYTVYANPFGTLELT